MNGVFLCCASAQCKTTAGELFTWPCYLTAVGEKEAENILTQGIKTRFPENAGYHSHRVSLLAVGQDAIRLCLHNEEPE